MAVRFDAAESYNVTLTLGSQSAFTIACWVKLSVDRNTFSSPWSTDNGSEGFILGTDSDGTTMKVYDDIAGAFVVSGPNMTIGAWYFFCVVVNGSSGTLYYRTASATSLTNATWTAGARTITRLIIGDDPYTEWINGAMAAFKFWTAALGATDVMNESLQYQPYRRANLQTFYPFVRAETTDYSGNGRTLSGGATVATEDGPPIAWCTARPRLILPATVAAPATSLSPFLPNRRYRHLHTR